MEVEKDENLNMGNERAKTLGKVQGRDFLLCGI
jgi:hypothetical protein